MALIERTFFSYYGGKFRDAKKNYPAPVHDTIVEPFAGAAGYSCRYPNRNVILCEKNPIIAGLWQYLVKVSALEILSLPDLLPGEIVDDLHVPQEAKWLVGFWLNRAADRPCRSPSKWMREGLFPNCFWGASVREHIAKQVPLIRHWRVYNVGFEDVPTPTLRATWFVDPPYRSKAGEHYPHGSKHVDYVALASWCRSLKGQVIVCENDGADWLPFRHLARAESTLSKRGARPRPGEAVWLSSSC